MLSVVATAAGLTACGGASSSGSGSAVAAPASGSATAVAATAAPIKVVAAENEYGSVASQIGGRYVRVQSIESSPNADPHTYELSPSVAQDVSSGQVLIENGIGYDDWMIKLASASPSATRQVVDVQHLLGLPDSTPNPHLWYAPATMPKVAGALAGDLARLQPAHAAYFRANVARFDASLRPWLAAIAAFRATHAGTPVATTEPVADYMLQALGARNLTPFSFQAAIMNGTDPSPQGISGQNALLGQHRVKVLVHNQQVTDPLTQSFVTAARGAGVPVVGVYETMPTPGYDYQSWMLAEVRAIEKAVVDRTSTSTL